MLIGPHDDGGWSQAHYEGLKYVEQNMPDAHIAYVENVPEGTESEQVIRSLARKGFDLILTTSFGYMDPTATVAEEFPDQTFIHISGYKSNNKNFGNLFGAMESMKYLAGQIAGARAKKDGNPKVGYMATFPIPEELRLGNAFALGMAKTCPECKLDVRWINTWHDPVVEKDAAASLFDGGAQVVFTGADTPAPADVATAKGKWGITYDFEGSCKAERCLTAPYWNWGPVYTKIAQGVKDKTYKPGFDYFDADSGGLGLYGFMPGQQLTKGDARSAARSDSERQGSTGADAGRQVHALRRLHRRDQGQCRQGHRAGRSEDAAVRSRSIPARRARTGMQVLHVLVESEHRGRTAEAAVTATHHSIELSRP